MSDGNVIGLPVPEREAYVSMRELAKMMGVSERTIQRWTLEDDMPSVIFGSRTRRYRPSSAIQWARLKGAA